MLLHSVDLKVEMLTCCTLLTSWLHVSAAHRDTMSACSFFFLLYQYVCSCPQHEAMCVFIKEVGQRPSIETHPTYRFLGLIRSFA